MENLEVKKTELHHVLVNRGFTNNFAEYVVLEFDDLVASNSSVDEIVGVIYERNSKFFAEF